MLISPRSMPCSTASVIARIASWASRIIGVSSISAPELASVSSMLFDSISRWLRRFWALISWPPLSRASPAKSLRPALTRSTLVWMRLVEWAMPSVWRSTMTTISVTSLTVSLIWPKPGLGGAAALDAGLDLGW